MQFKSATIISLFSPKNIEIEVLSSLGGRRNYPQAGGIRRAIILGHRLLFWCCIINPTHREGLLGHLATERLKSEEMKKKENRAEVIVPFYGSEGTRRKRGKSKVTHITNVAVSLGTRFFGTWRVKRRSFPPPVLLDRSLTRPQFPKLPSMTPT